MEVCYRSLRDIKLLPRSLLPNTLPLLLVLLIKLVLIIIVPSDTLEHCARPLEVFEARGK